LHEEWVLRQDQKTTMQGAKMMRSCKLFQSTAVAKIVDLQDHPRSMIFISFEKVYSTSY